MQIIAWGIYAAAAYFLADWRNWRKYYPTYLFMLVANFFAAIVTFNHTLWIFKPTFLLANHTLTEFYIAFVAYLGTVMLFLSRYPKQNLMWQIGWILLWVGAYTLSELIPQYLGLVGYSHGWSLGWSIVHNLIMFPLIKLHHISPVWAWLVSAVYFVFVYNYFGLSIQDLKYN